MIRQSTRRVVGLAALWLCAACARLSPEQEHFAKGYSAYNQGDFTSAVLYLKPLVEAGNPAAQLLMAKMYSNGDGVQADEQKANLLRNLAAFQIYKKKNLTPGELRNPANSLASISQQLDTYVQAGEGKQAPVQDLNQILQSLDIHHITDLSKAGEDQGPDQPDFPPAPQAPAPGVTIDLPAALAPKPASATGESSVAAPEAAAIVSASPIGDQNLARVEASRGSDQISLSIIRQAANSGDAAAMGLLSSAYTHGYYGLTISTAQAAAWAERAQEARQQQTAAEVKSPAVFPTLPAALVVVIGLAMIAGGIGLALKNRSR